MVASRNLLHFKLKLTKKNWKYVLTGDGCQLMRCCFFSPFDFELYPSNILQENLKLSRPVTEGNKVYLLIVIALGYTQSKLEGLDRFSL